MKYFKYYGVIIVLLFIGCFKKNDQKLNMLNDFKDKSKGLLVCDSTHFNYTKIERGTILKKNFLFKNVGSENVKITNVQRSCGCTNLDIPKKNINPQDSILIRMEINTNDKKKGLHSINAVLTTNGVRETYILLVKFDVI